MNFKTRLTIEDACRDSWNWQKNNPKGYDEQEDELCQKHKELN